MELTINELLEGKPLIIKNKEFLSTKTYVEPFLERLSKYTDNFIAQAISPDILSKQSNEGEINNTFSRVWVQAVMPDEAGFDNHDRVCGMVYGLDVRKPVVKFYVGGLNRACCNLCVFSPSFLDVKELEPEKAIDYRVIDRLLTQTDNVRSILEKLSNTDVEYDEVKINENLGDWVRKTMNMSFTNQLSKVKLSTSSAIDAYKLLYEKEDSPYFVPKGTNTDMFNIYNAWTQVITNDSKDIVNKAEKTLLVGNILGV